MPTGLLDGTYGPDQVFHPAPAPSQRDIEQLVERVGKRILRFLQAKCQSPLRLISLIKSEPVARKILVAMHLVPSGPRAFPPCPTRMRRARRPQTRPNSPRPEGHPKTIGNHRIGKIT